MQLTQKKRQRSDLMTAAAVAALLAVMAALYPAGPAPMMAMSIMRQPPPGQGEPRARAA